LHLLERERPSIINRLVMAESQLLVDKTHEVLHDNGQVSLRQRFIRGVSWNLVGTFLAQGSVFAANIVVANRLGPESFGEFSLLQNTALTLSAIAQMATGVTATRYIAEYRASDPDRAGRIIGFCALFTLATGLIAGLLLFALAGWLSTTILNAPHLSDGLKIMAVYLVFSAMSGCQMGALAGLEGYRRIARLGALHGMIHIALCAACVWFYGLSGALWGLVASLVVRWWLYHVAIRQEAAILGIKPAYVMHRHERGVLFRFSVPAALAGFTTMPALWLANTFLAQQPDGYTQLGLYSAAINLKAAVMFLPLTVNTVSTSLINNQLGIGQKARYRRVFLANTFVTAGSALFGTLVAVTFGGYFLKLFGAEFEKASDILLVLMLAVVPESLMISLYQIVQSREKMWWSFFAVALPRDVLVCGLAFVLVPSMAAAGLAWSYLLASVVALCPVIYFVWKSDVYLSR
jgi:O-antigen/teichoic acid export membrane protein